MNVENRRCVKCLNEYSSDTKNFYLTGNKTLNTKCKLCMKSERRNRYAIKEKSNIEKLEKLKYKRAHLTQDEKDIRNQYMRNYMLNYSTLKKKEFLENAKAKRKQKKELLL